MSKVRLFECMACGALVKATAIDTHKAWHRATAAKPVRRPLAAPRVTHDPHERPADDDADDDVDGLLYVPAELEVHGDWGATLPRRVDGWPVRPHGSNE